jgi:exocyst complex component 8
MILPPAPPPPILSAAPPPLTRRRFQKTIPSSSPPPIGSADSPAYSGIKSPNGVLSPNSVDSAYSNVNTGPVPPQPPRARTPVAAAKHLPPLSAPAPNTNLISPLPRSPMSAAPFRIREVSESLREHKDSDSYKSREGKSDWDRTDYRDRDRLSRSARASPIPHIPRSPVLLPPRSANRPGSAMSQRTPVAVPQHEGMI